MSSSNLMLSLTITMVLAVPVIAQSPPSGISGVITSGNSVPQGTNITLTVTAFNPTRVSR